MRIPQATEQYVQVLRVSVAAVSLNGRTEAANASPAKPKPKASRVDAARVAPVSLTKPRRLKFIVTHSNKSRVQTWRKFTANPMRRQSIGQAAHPSAQSCRPEAQTSNCGSRLVPSRSVLPSACIVSPIASATTLQLMTFWPWIVRIRQSCRAFASSCIQPASSYRHALSASESPLQPYRSSPG